MGAYSSVRREEDRWSHSYTWRGRKEGREGWKEGDRDGGREDQSLLTSRACAFLYLKFDALWPLDNLMLKISPK